MASVSLEYQSRLISLTEKMYFTPIVLGAHKKPRRRHDLELAVRSKFRPEDASHSSKVVAWLKTLSLSARYQVICDKNPWLSSCLRQMFVRKVKEGDGVFSLSQDQQRPYESMALDENFKYKRVTSEGGPTEKAVEEAIRFADGSDYLDTVTLTGELIADFEKLLRTLNDLTNSKLFQYPCRAVWDPLSKVWLWETPGWNSGVDQSLSSWAICCIERHIWMRYWETMRIDPRAASEMQPYSMDLPTIEGYLANRSALCEHWKDLPASLRCPISPSTPDLDSLFTTEKSKYCKEPTSQYSYPRPAFTTLANSSLYNSFSSNLMGMLGGPAGTYYSACRARMQGFQNGKTVEVVGKVANERDFVDFLFLSPLDRAGSIFDALLRTLASRLNSSYQQQLADDLIASESFSKPKRSPKRPGHRQKPRRKSSDVSTAGTAQGHITEDDEEINTFVSGILAEIVSNLRVGEEWGQGGGGGGGGRGGGGRSGRVRGGQREEVEKREKDGVGQ